MAAKTHNRYKNQAISNLNAVLICTNSSFLRMVKNKSIQPFMTSLYGKFVTKDGFIFVRRS